VRARCLRSILMSLCLMATMHVYAAEIPFFVGSCPFGPFPPSKGIYRGSLDAETGKLGPLTLAAAVTNPAFLALSHDGHFLYAALNQSKACLAAFRIEAGGRLRLLNRVSFMNAAIHPGGSLHLSCDSTGKQILAAWWQGPVAAFSTAADGSIASQASYYVFKGSGPAIYQETAHPHSIYPDPSNRFVYVCDLGSDVIGVFNFDSQTGALMPKLPFARLAPGSGPRHLAFGSDGRFVYVNNQMGLSVSVFARNPSTGTLTLLQTISTFPPGTAPPLNTNTSEIACHPSGRWLYVATRGPDSAIVVYAIKSDGLLEWVEAHPAEVKIPHNFAIDPSGQWLIAGGGDDHRIVVLRIDPATGRLATTGQEASINTPSCIVFPVAR